MNYTPPSETGPCQYLTCEREGKWRRQNTQYVVDEKNWGCYCEECQEIVDEYWKDQWADLYGKLL